MANRQAKASNILKAIQAVPSWSKVKGVMEGNVVEDSASFPKGTIKFEVLDGQATWKSDFATVTLKQMPGGDFSLKVTGCANPASETCKSLSAAAMKFVVTAWHVGCRGII